jgi:Outer membrane protein beta-barrel domain
MTILILHMCATAGYSQEEGAPQEAKARAVKPLPHELSFKFGFHQYPDSDYFSSNSAYFNESDLSSAAVELEYDYLWLYPDYTNTSLGLAVGYYDGQTAYQTICCSDVSFSTLYTLLSLKYKFEPSRLAPLYWYVGTGVGYYLFDRDVTVLGVRDHFSQNVFGGHFLLGAGWPISPRLRFFTEARYAFAKIKSANELNDALGIGGATFSMGVSWQFQDFAHILPALPATPPAGVPSVQKQGAPAVREEKAPEPPAVHP